MKMLYLKIAVSSALFLSIFYIVDVEATLINIKNVKFSYILLIVILAFMDRFLMSYKWNILLKAQAIRVSNFEAFTIYMASGFIGTFLPSGLGSDIFRAFRSKLRGLKVDGVTATIVVERVIGLLAVISLAQTGLTILMLWYGSQFQGLYYWTWIFLGGISTLLIISLQRVTFEIVRRLLERFQQYRLVRFYLDFHSAYLFLGGQRKALLIFFMLSCLEQGLQSLMNFYGALALALPAGLLYFIALIPLSTLIERLPISINAIGVQEAGYVLLLSIAGLSATESLSLALLMRAIGWVMLIPGGVIYLYDTFRYKQYQGSAVVAK